MENSNSDASDDVIDDLVNKFYILFEEILDLSNFLENNIKNGWLNLSKAKYTMGSCELVSKLQYNWQQLETDEALCKVETSSEEIFGVNSNQYHIKFSLNSREDKSKANRDPIKWFGLLSPQCLKDSQKDFQRVINIAIELVSKKELLVALRQDICDKMKCKSNK